MFSKYFKLLLFLTMLVEASPKLFESYANQMETFKEVCISYKKDPKIPTEIKNKCKTYISSMGKVFKYGYTLDHYVDSENVDLDKAEKYNILLHELEEEKQIISALIHNEMEKAIEKSDVDYFTFLLSGNQINIYFSEYEFMDKNKQIFGKNEQYIKYKKDIENKKQLKLEKERKQKEGKICSDLSNEMLYHYTYALNQIKKGQTREADRTYKASLKKKEIFIASCNDGKHKKKIINGLTDADNILKRNALSLNVKKRGSHIGILSHKAKKLEDEISVMNKNHAINLAKIERDRQKSRDDINRRIQELEGKGSGIMSKCKAKWGTDYRMVKYCVKKQTEARRNISSLPDNNIIRKCKAKWGTDYRMVKYCTNKQTTAKRDISSLPGNNIMRKCKAKWGTDHRMVKYCYDKQAEAKRSLGL